MQELPHKQFRAVLVWCGLLIIGIAWVHDWIMSCRH
jgi:hypothetical protein